MNIAKILRMRAKDCSHAPAIIDTFHGRRRATTFGMLDELADRGASTLIRSGVKPGESVLIFQPMSAELYAALVAVFRAGAVAMFLDPSSGLGHIDRCCGLNPPTAFIASAKAQLLRLRSPAIRRIPRKFAVGGWIPGALKWPGSEGSSIPDVASEAALITFTSGSTGEPKAAVRTHDFLMAQHRVLERTLGLRPGIVDLATLPVFVLANLASGLTTVIPDADLRRPGDVETAGIIDQIACEQVSSTAASPAFLNRVAASCPWPEFRLSSLEKIFVGGAPVFPPLLDRLRAVAPGAGITSVYGSTEAEPICELRAGEIGKADLALMREGRGLLVGRPVEEISLRVMTHRWGDPRGPYTADSFEDDCVGPGIAGEIVVSGSHVLTGYLGGRGDQETKFRVEGKVWHRTGDCGYLDENGRVWLLGRASARIKDEIGELYPFTVECALSFNPHVKRSAVLASGCKRLLFVEWDHSPWDEPAVVGLIKWASIDAVVRCSKIPVDSRHNAKVDYVALERMARRYARTRW